MIDLIIIDNDEKLLKFVNQASKSDILCVDTEFMREKTYYPKLCLLQFQTRLETYILDPFLIDNLSPLKKLFLDKEIVKVFHAATQDIEILHNELGCMPTTIFDTQIAAGLTDGLNQPGLSTLLGASIGVKISKNEGFSDWSIRPLSKSQIKYAAEDVAYLPQLYDYQINKMKERGQEAWLQDEFLALEDASRFCIVPENRYKHLKHATRLSKKQLCLAREIASWREIKAQKADVPRKWILSDEQIVEICRKNPTNVDALFSVRGVSKRVDLTSARQILDAIKVANKCDPRDWPVIAESNLNEENVDEIVPLLAAVVLKRAKENGVSQALIASNNDLVDFARGHFESSPLMSGWRKSLVGEELKKLLDGEINLSCNGCSLEIKNESMQK